MGVTSIPYNRPYTESFGSAGADPYRSEAALRKGKGLWPWSEGQTDKWGSLSVNHHFRQKAPVATLSCRMSSAMVAEQKACHEFIDCRLKDVRMATSDTAPLVRILAPVRFV